MGVETVEVDGSFGVNLGRPVVNKWDSLREGWRRALPK